VFLKPDICWTALKAVATLLAAVFWASKSLVASASSINSVSLGSNLKALMGAVEIISVPSTLI